MVSLISGTTGKNQSFFSEVEIFLAVFSYIRAKGKSLLFQACSLNSLHKGEQYGRRYDSD